MLTELLLIAGAGFLGKKALENPEKAKDVMTKIGDNMAKKAMKSDDLDCQAAALKYYEARERDEMRSGNFDDDM